MQFRGNIVDNNSGLSGGGTGRILINGSSSQTITSTGVIDQGKFPDVTVSNTGGTVTFPSFITVVGDWTYTSGTLDVTTNNSTVVFENTMSITGNAYPKQCNVQCKCSLYNYDSNRHPAYRYRNAYDHGLSEPNAQHSNIRCQWN